MQDLCLDKLGVFEASRENQADGQAADADRRGLGGLSVSPSAPQPQTAPATLALLPGDVLARIFGFLDCPTQHSFIRVSRSLHAVKVLGPYKSSVAEEHSRNKATIFAVDVCLSSARQPGLHQRVSGFSVLQVGLYPEYTDSVTCGLAGSGPVASANSVC